MISNQIKQRLEWLDILRGLGILLVILGHIYSNQFAVEWIYAFHMPLFFFTSGWIYRKRPIMADLKRRLKTVVIPYFCFGALILLYWILLERRFRDATIGVSDGIMGLFLARYDLLEFNVHLWFLPCFFLTTVIYNILMHVANRRLVLLLSLAACAAVTLYPLPDMPWCINLTVEYIGYFAIGNALAELKLDQRMEKLRRIPLALSGVLLLLAVGGIVHAGLTAGLMPIAIAMLGIFGCTGIALAIGRNRVLQYLGRISLVVLCIHGPLYRVIIKLLSLPFLTDTEGVRESFMLSILVLLFTCGICCCAYEIIRRIAPFMIGAQKLKGNAGAAESAN